MQGNGDLADESLELPDVRGLGPYAAQNAINEAFQAKQKRDHDQLIEYWKKEDIRMEAVKLRILKEAREANLEDLVKIPANLIREKARQVGQGREGVCAK